MIRLMGAALLTAGSAALGLGAVVRLEGRVSDLRGILAGLDAMDRTLAARLAPLDEMFFSASEITRGRPHALFLFCAQALRCESPLPFRETWAAALREMPLCLVQTDLDLLQPLGGVLGQYDGDSQSVALVQCISQLRQQLEAAAQRRRNVGKVYATMGVSVGLLLAILLL